MARIRSEREHLAAPRRAGSFTPFAELPHTTGDSIGRWLDAVEIEPISATEWRCTERWELGPRVVPDSMWFYFITGQGWGSVGAGGRRFKIQPGDLMLIPQGAEHVVRQAAGSAMHLYAVHFHARVFGGINLLDLLGFPAHLPRREVAPYGPANERVAREHALRAPGWRRAMGAEISGVLMQMVRHEGRRFRGPGGGEAHAELPRLLPALEWIERNLDDPGLKVAGIARQLHVSEVQARKLFRRVIGTSPIRFVQRRRIDLACQLLRASGLPIEQIAEQCGFSESPFFFRVFKKWTGTTPRAYRDGQGL